MHNTGDHVPRYFRYARHIAWKPFKPFLVIVCGLTGSGKSTLARELGERLAMPVINSDSVRKAMAGNPGKYRAVRRGYLRRDNDQENLRQNGARG